MSKIAINKKKIKINLAIINSLFVVIIVAIISFTFLFGFINLKKFNLSNYIEIFSRKYGYTLETIEINGLNKIAKNEISQNFDFYLNKSIFLVPIKKIAQTINNNNWVNSVEIKNNLKNKVTIKIKESEPVAVYFNGKNYLYIDEFGKVIDFAKSSDAQDYIILEGHNAYKKIILLLDAIPNELKSLVVKAHYVNDRRWDIYTKDKLKVKLPENEYEKALKIFIDIHNDLYTPDIKNIKFIDLRLPKKVIINFNNENS